MARISQKGKNKTNLKKKKDIYFTKGTTKPERYISIGEERIWARTNICELLFSIFFFIFFFPSKKKKN